MAETNQQTTEALEPPTLFTIHWCPDCGRDDRIQSFKATHYSRGEICRGTPIELKYSCVSTPIAPVVDENDQPMLEDLAIEAASLLDSLPTYASDNTIHHAQQMAFALRSCVSTRNSEWEAAARQVKGMFREFGWPERLTFTEAVAEQLVLMTYLPLSQFAAPASTAAIRDEVPTFKNTKEAMLYAQRQGIPAVVPYTSPSTVARKAAEEAAKEIAQFVDRVQPFPFASGLLEKDILAIIERCLSAEGADRKGSAT